MKHPHPPPFSESTKPLATDPIMPEKDYQKDYYSWRARHALSAAEVIAPFLIERYSPRSVVDLGCAEGAWLSVFARQGVEFICGFDGPWGKKEDLLIPEDRFFVVDLENFKAPDGEKHDLAISLEVAEHLKEEVAENFVLQLTRLSELVLFSAAVPGQGGLHHMNEQPPDYWRKKFERNGYVQHDILRPRFWQDTKLAWWYRQNFFLYEKSSRNDGMNIKASDTTFHGAHLIHPHAFEEKIEELSVDKVSVRNLVKAFFSRLKSRFVRW